MKWIFGIVCLFALLAISNDMDKVERRLENISIQLETIKIMIERSKGA